MSTTPPAPPPPPPPAPPVSPACSAGGLAYVGAVLADNPWGFWRLSETSGTMAHDCSRNGTHVGSYVGAITLGALSRGAGAAAASVAPELLGTTGYVSLGVIPAATGGGPFGGSYSVELWFVGFFFGTQASGAIGTFDCGSGQPMVSQLDRRSQNVLGRKITPCRFSSTP